MSDSEFFKPMAGTACRLGYGGAELPVWSQRRSLSLLEQAYDLGVRHFDTARKYGDGEAERILGLFARSRRGEITIATKFGLDPAPWSAKRRVRLWAREAIEFVPPLFALWKFERSRRVPPPISGSESGSSRFTVDVARRNLETSLRLLQTDCIDLWLLHEADARDAAHPALIDFLEDMKRQGKIRAYGIGSVSWRVQRDVERYPAAYRVLQFDDNPIEPTLPRVASRADTFAITHGNVRALPQLRQQLRSLRIDDRLLGALLLRRALRNNRDGGVLFSSRKKGHLAANLAALHDPAISDAMIDSLDQCLRSI